jgi:hypothetical protein
MGRDAALLAYINRSGLLSKTSPRLYAVAKTELSCSFRRASKRRRTSRRYHSASVNFKRDAWRSSSRYRYRTSAARAEEFIWPLGNDNNNNNKLQNENENNNKKYVIFTEISPMRQGRPKPAPHRQRRQHLLDEHLGRRGNHHGHDCRAHASQSRRGRRRRRA